MGEVQRREWKANDGKVLGKAWRGVQLLLARDLLGLAMVVAVSDTNSCARCEKSRMLPLLRRLVSGI